jgi:hypothetical protein
MVAFRNVVPSIPLDTAVDEISIQAIVTQLGYRLVYEPQAIVFNRGPSTVRDAASSSAAATLPSHSCTSSMSCRLCSSPLGDRHGHVVALDPEPAEQLDTELCNG